MSRRIALKYNGETAIEITMPDVSINIPISWDLYQMVTTRVKGTIEGRNFARTVVEDDILACLRSIWSQMDKAHASEGFYKPSDE